MVLTGLTLCIPRKGKKWKFPPKGLNFFALRCNSSRILFYLSPNANLSRRYPTLNCSWLAQSMNYTIFILCIAISNRKISWYLLMGTAT